ncbi:retinol dehydrogenase 8-like [Glandiceps talaboti]
MSQQQIVLVTGCSSGLGLALAVKLAKDADKRYKVFSTMRNLAKKGALEEAAGDTVNKTLFIRQLDVNSDESVKNCFDKLLKDEGRIDILVNNAGLTSFGVFEIMGIDKVRSVMETNYFGPVRTCQAVIPNMKQNKSGKIINVSSILAIKAGPFFDLYCASKAALESLSEALAPTLRQFNVFLSVIELGPVLTPIQKKEGAMVAAIDFSRTDEHTGKLAHAASNASNTFSDELAQTPEQVAQAIVNIIEEEKPNFRYQSSEAMAGMAKGVLVDPTGEESVTSSIKTSLNI